MGIENRLVGHIIALAIVKTGNRYRCRYERDSDALHCGKVKIMLPAEFGRG